MAEGKKSRSKTRRKKGAGSLLARGGRWVLRWRENGRLCQETTDYRVAVKADRARAEVALAEHTKLGRLKERRDKLAVLIAELQDVEAQIRELEHKATPATPERQALKLENLVATFRDSPRRRDCSAAQLEIYERQIGDFVEWAGRHVEVSAVDDAAAERYAAELAKRYSGGTYNKHLNALTACWRALGSAAGVQANPWQGLPRKRLEAHTRRVLERAEITRILKAATGELRDLICIGLHTGLRMGDACRLKWDAFGADDSLEVSTAKTGAFVRIPGAGLLRDLKRHNKSGYIVPGLAATYERDPAAVSKAVERLFKSAKIKTSVKRAGWSRARADASFHSLRHTFVTRAIEAGVPAAIVRALVGHSREAMTEPYTHVGAAAVLEAFSAAKTPPKKN